MPVLKALINGEWVRVSGTGDPDTARWNSAWGVIAVGSFAINQGTGLTSDFAITNPLTVTLVSGRRYRIVCCIRAIATTEVNSACSMQLMNNGVRESDDQWTQIIGNRNYTQHRAEFNRVGDGASHTFDIHEVGSFTTGVITAFPTYWYVEDVGPVSVAASPPTRPPSVWQTAVYENGWTTLDSRPAMYRKVGDEVSLRGVIKAGTIAWGTAAFTLPPGYRPLSSSMSFPANAQGSAATVDVFSDGRVSIAPISTGVIAVGGWCYIDPVRFSVS